uniref:Ubiquitin carboxyl-terminal hydrolase n=1 Tax=Sinocyclocheilus grahami TaxID=75366 RepID=A0A672NBR6_SINGR
MNAAEVNGLSESSSEERGGHQQTLLNQLREVTGTTDVQLLQQALQVSNGDLAEAVAFLTEKNAKVPQQDEATYYQTAQITNDRYISVGSQADTNVIDLTGDDKDDLQRAIALSLEESNRAFRETGITDEEQAISRVLEASIAENKASLKRTHTEVWSDSPNPHDRKRQENCPVGLKNVGNTCWFSAVIQSLFNLLEFQRLVLHYPPPARMQDLPHNQKEHRNLPFMQELRCLFSLLVGSKRKYVDPSRAVEILKDAFKSSESQQQDVSEFTHKLLDWLEDAFQIKAEEDSFPLYLGVPLSYHGLEHFLFWILYMQCKILMSAIDSRYMDRNRDITRIKREEIRRLKEHLTVLQQRLERYLSYGSGPKRFPLADVLQFAMEFASSKPVCTSPVEDIDTTAPPVFLCMDYSTGEQPDASVPPEGSGSGLLAQQQQQQQQQPQRVSIHKPFTQSRVPPDLPMHPAPRHITEEELRVLEGCLHRWRSEVENDTRDLQTSISRIHRTIELMYSDKSMMQVPYRLHAVLVHEGQANAGHYWAYIFNPHQQRWMKYNDISVTKSSWEELVRDSFGGYRNASAYCLMYIDDKKPFLIEEEFDKETGQMLSGLDKLPPDLKEYVEADNKLFEREMEEWDALQARKLQQEKLALAAASVAAQPMKYMEQQSPTGDSKHLQEDTERAISKAAAEHDEKSPEALLNTAMKVEYTRLLRFAQEDTPPERDYRLHHVIVYFIHNQVPKKIVERTLLMQFADRNLGFDERCKSIMKVAHAKLELIKPDEVNMEEYEMCHQDYRKFRDTTVFLLIGLELFLKKSYVESLMYLIYAYQYNKELLAKGPYRGHDEELIAHYRRECLLKVNEHAAALFETGEETEVNTGLSIMNELVVACIPLLLVDEMEEKDMVAVEDMRNRWCSYLGQEMEPNLQEKLTDFLPKLLDCSTEIKSFHDPPKLPSYSTLELCERYGRVMMSLTLSRTPADGR